jgi:methionyl aminopeptidase
MISIRSSQQIEKMRLAGTLLHQALNALKPLIRPGVATLELDRTFEKMIRDAGAVPSFKDYNGYPASICASPNEQVVHGIPNGEPLPEGAILSVDAGLVLNGWQADSAFTAPVGTASAESLKLIEVTEKCFWIGAKAAKEGNRIGDIGYAVSAYAEKFGYGVIRDLCGHGIGQDMHESPDVPNFGAQGTGVRLRAGMTIAIEPMIAQGQWPVYRADDGWTIFMRDRSRCAHYEHTILVTDAEPVILTLPGKIDWGALTHEE